MGGNYTEKRCTWKENIHQKGRHTILGHTQSGHTHGRWNIYGKGIH